MKRLNRLHNRLRKYRYFYYELNSPLISDAQYDSIQRGYGRICDKLKIPKEVRVTNFTGFDLEIPTNIFHALILKRL